MFDINSTVEQLFLALDRNKFNKEAKFSPSIKLLPQLVGIKGRDYESRGNTVFHDGVWMTHDYLTGKSNPPKTFHTEAEDIKDSDLEAIIKRLDGVHGTLNLKKHLPEIKKLSESYFEKKDDAVGKKITEAWKDVERENKDAIASREKALAGLESLVGQALAEKVKTTLLCIPDPKDAVEHIKDNFKNIKQKEVKKKEEKPKGYVPVFDKDKKELTKKDIDYILEVIKENHKKGLDGIINPIKKLFSGDIINTLVMAYRKYEGLEGLIHFLEHYDTMNEKLQKLPPKMKLHSDIGEISAPVKDVLTSIQKIKSKSPSAYKGSFFEFTENALELLLKYIKNGEKIPEFEKLFSEMFFSGMIGEIPKKNLPEGVHSDDGVMSQWRALKHPEVYNKIKSIKNDVISLLEKPESGKKWKDQLEHLKLVEKGDKKMVDEQESDGKYVKEIKKMINNPVYITEEDIELIKELKQDYKEDTKKIFDDQYEERKKLKDEGKSIEKTLKDLKNEAKKYTKHLKEMKTVRENIESGNGLSDSDKDLVKKIDEMLSDSGSISKKDYEDLSREDMALVDEIEKEKNEIEKKIEEIKKTPEFTKHQEIKKKLKELDDSPEGKERKEKNEKYKEYQKKLKDLGEKEKLELMTPEERTKYKQEKERKKEEERKKREEKKETKKSSNLPLFTKIESLSSKSQNPLVKAELGAILDTLKTVL